MSYGSYACHATIITEEGLFELSEEFNFPMFYIEEVESLYSEVFEYLDEMEREFCEIINSQNKKLLPDNLTDLFFIEFDRLVNFVNSIEEHTGLIINLAYEGETGGVDDDVNEEYYWEVANAFEYTASAKKYKNYLVDAQWVIYG